ncbi:suppressor for copper-sensitivity B [Thalassobaculum fulvum]|uniref:Suppressor for copper-sensitivity B n=1 Tax=Thalassobaculum fulvum TaxID=1633335 RepID=A0A918XU65_9PROT|nr:protein-disulfide reductase DsbD domain-containing protein [Thalassobaculum fulvum]GHD56552.1 suppressor for copper-sensitivity B [Thalassobaculum fulvum]
MAFFASKRALGIALLLFVALVAGPAAGRAGEGGTDWVRTETADIRLVSAVAGTAGRESVLLGLEFRLSDGWKVYWRSAGDVGYPPQVDWTGSDNLGQTAMLFPVPHRFSAFGIEQYGYSGHVVYPIEARPAEPGKPLVLRAAVNALVCSEICVPLDATLALDLPAAPAKPTPFTQMLDRWSARVPADLPGLGLDVRSARATGDPASPTLVLELASDVPLQAPDVFPEGPAGLTFGKPEATFGADRRTAELRVPVGAGGDARLSGASLTLTLVDGERFAERPVVVGAGSPAGPARSPATWLAMLGAAVLGGLILNLMPCVLPVLSLKLLAAVGYGGAGRGAVRRGFLASAAGILASFLVLAAGAVALKSAGVAIGWGIQFQQPVFLAAMATLVVLFAANLWGLFEVPLPRSFADLAARMPAEDPTRNRHHHETSLTGHFLTGAFATLLATPCSAPFLGTAIGFALAGGPAEIVSVFAAMGLGLALPYLAVAAVPDLARMLPRPGRWMTVLKRVLSLALAATAIWLLTVLAAQTGAVPALAIAGVFAAVLAAMAVVHRRGLALPLGALAAIVAVAVAGVADRPVPDRETVTAGAGDAAAVAWRPFDRAEVDRLVADGRVVLVDVTADWCLTCKVNKAAVLDRGPVAARLADGSVLAMRADWTSPNPAITEYLASFGRYGIPFNAVYGPAAPRGIALPELLTEEAVLAALRQAGAGPATARLD